MGDRRVIIVALTFVIGILVLSSLGLLAGLGAAAAAAPHGSAFSVATAKGSEPASAEGAGAVGGLPGSNFDLNGVGATPTVNPVANEALAQARAAGVPSTDVFVPRASASPAQVAQSHSQGHVTPLYGGNNPAPIGLADFGLSADPNGNGSVVPSILNTPSVLATFAPNATGIQPLYPFSSTPDGYGVQLNSVTTSINLFGNATYSFWTQNVVEYLAQSHELILVTNVWNFSGPSLSSNAIYAHGPYGQQVGTTFYYSEYPILTGVTYPFSIDLWMNNSLVGGRNAVNFTVALNESGTTSVFPYDYVVFNSTANTSGPVAASQYTANGYQYNAFGLTDDFEVILGGPGGGSQANLYAADANFTLQYWNTTSSSYQAVPSAFSYGGETGETVTGAYVGWQNASDGAPYGVVRTGPPMLVGLWNATGAPGLGQVDITVSPENAFLFFGPNWTSNFTQGDLPYWAPQETTNTFWLAPGTYTYAAILSDYTPVISSITVSLGTNTITVSLALNTAEGIYTPLWAWNNGQFAAISSGGAGTPSDPYQVYNAQTTPMLSIFGTWNDFAFPVFTGVFFFDTSASVVLSNMSNLLTTMPYPGISANTDALGYVFYNVSNVALVNSTNISGWYDSGLYNPVAYPAFAGNYYATFSVVLWNSSGNLIDNNTFETQSGGLTVYGGSNNTVFGNTFTMAPFPYFPGPVSPLNLSLGLQETESGDLIYNNAFDTSTTAVTEPFDLYSGAPIVPVDTWNITPTPAATVNHATNFPDFPLTGTIVGNATQGGNYWWDYGSTSNPLGTLPYTEVVSGQSQIFTGGDYWPLVPPPTVTYALTFSETGLPSGTHWAVHVQGVSYPGTTSSIQVLVQNGSYPWYLVAVTGYHGAPANGTAVISGAPVTVLIAYSANPPPPKYAVTFSETGLAAGTNWQVTLNGTTLPSSTSAIVFEEANGSYPFSIPAVTGYAPSPASGSVTVDGSAQGQGIAFSAVASSYTLSFVESGLTAGTQWTVQVGTSIQSSTTAWVNFTEAPGTYGYEIGAIAGFTSSPTSGSTTVLDSNTTVPVAFTKLASGEFTVIFTETGLPTGTSWSVTLGTTTTPSTGTTIAFTEMNGTYSYSVGAVNGYTIGVASGSIKVAGENTGATVVFTAVPPGTFALTFTETGLQSGTNWSVTIGTSTVYSQGGDVVSFHEANGTVNYQVGAVNGYSSSPATGSVTLAGAAKNVEVTFTANGGSSSSSSSGLSTLDYAIIAVVILLLVIAAVYALSRRGRGGSTQYAPSEYSATETAPPEGPPGPPSGGAP